MVKAGVGINQNLSDHKKAASDAGVEALGKLGGSQPNIVFAFSSIQYNQEDVLAGLKSVFPSALIVGGSAAGEITSWVTNFDSVNVMAVASDQISFATGIGANVQADSSKAGAMAVEDLIKNKGGQKPNLLILIVDGMAANGSAVVEGARSVLGADAPMIGGSAGDDYLFKKTYEYYNDKVVTDTVVAVGFYGDFSYGFGIRHGWTPVGLPVKVTKANGVWIQELDGQPALKLYEDYFGKEASELVKEPLARMAYTYPIGIAVEGSDELLIRDPVIANEKGEISMAAAIPEGATVRLMIGDKDKAIDAAKWAAEMARGQLEGRNPAFILMFNCMARNKLLGLRCHEENQIVQKAIGAEVPMLGFYTYGEIGPLLGKKNTPAYFHNETMTLLVVGE
ncbi:MAG: FIST N-terminal domain-containing protein [Patescibacteria group bacterium]